MLFTCLHHDVTSSPARNRHVPLSNRLLHPCYSEVSTVFDYDDDETSEVVNSQYIDSLKIEICEAEQRAHNFISMMVPNACLNIRFNTQSTRAERVS